MRKRNVDRKIRVGDVVVVTHKFGLLQNPFLVTKIENGFAFGHEGLELDHRYRSAGLKEIRAITNYVPESAHV